MIFLWTFFEIAGTIAFAISGALVGISRRMDIFGILVLALSTAIGGGIIRDVLVGNIPPNSFKTSLYIVLTTVITFIIFFIYRNQILRYMSRRKLRKIYLLADTLGLASFTVTGTTIGFNAYPEYPLFAITLGLITAVGGGIIGPCVTSAKNTFSITRRNICIAIYNWRNSILPYSDYR